MQDFAYNMNLLACMSFPSSESYIYVKKIVVMSINVHVSESFANVGSVCSLNSLVDFAYYV